MQCTNTTTRWLVKTLFTVMLCFGAVILFGQSPTDSFPKDPGRIAVYNVQQMNFGAFYQGNSGGTIALSTSGMRSATGDVVAINQGVSANQAIFEVEGIPGTMVIIQTGPDVTLTGNNGGTMNMHIGNPSPASPYTITVTPPGRTQFSFGGTLTVGNQQQSKAGVYSGSFSIMFIQQ